MDWLGIMHRWARFLKQQTLITIYRLPTKENKLLFSVNIYIYIEIETAAYIQIYLSISIYLYMYLHLYRYILLYLHIYMLPFQMKNGSPVDFP
jgi:hypothetical protein